MKPTIQWEILIFLCTAMVCLTLLLVTHIVPWPWVLSTGVALLFWLARSPFASPLERAALMLMQRELGSGSGTTSVTATLTEQKSPAPAPPKAVVAPSEEVTPVEEKTPAPITASASEERKP
jgi:hypothetical protein